MDYSIKPIINQRSIKLQLTSAVVSVLGFRLRGNFTRVSSNFNFDPQE